MKGITYSFIKIRSWGGYNDELVWAAAWIYKATDEQEYLEKAKSIYQYFGMGRSEEVFSWDNKKPGIYALMAELVTDNTEYRESLENYCDYAIHHGQRSPKGQLYYMTFGSLRFTSNTAFICMQVSIF